MTSITRSLTTQITQALQALELPTQSIDIDTAPAFGDYSCNIAMKLFAGADKTHWKSPHALAQDIVDHLDASEMVTASVAGPGFINFSLTTPTLVKHLKEAQQNVFAGLDRVKDKVVIVEYSSPNIAKPFTVGHLRSTIIGEALANLLTIKGYQVHRDNHLGDWGTQFGKLIYAIKQWGDITDIESAPRPVKLLVDLYVRFHQEAETNPEIEDEARAWFTKLEQGNTEARELWKKCIDWSWKEFDAIYKELGSAPFTENNGRGYGESYFEDKMGPVIDELKEKQLLKTGKEGAQIVEFDEALGLPPLMILKKDGSTLYATRDLATDKFRRETYGKDITVINEVGAEQSLYFKQLFALEQMLGWYKEGQRVHVGHGFFRLKEGKMSTRKGTVIWLEDVLEEAKKRARELAKTSSKSGDIDITRNSQIIGIGALKWNDLKRSSHLDVVFDWDDVLNMQGNSGPYIQYVAVRCKSILEKAQTPTTDVSSYSPNEEETLVLRALSKLPDVIDACIEEYAPHYVCTYLYELGQTFNSFYNKHQVLNQGEASSFRLLLTEVVGQALEQGLLLLGIKTPEKM